MSLSDNELKILIDAAHKAGNYDRAEELQELQRKQRFQDFHQTLWDNDNWDLY